MMFGKPMRAFAPSAKLLSLPAPVGGLNNNAPAMGMSPTDCMALYNMLAADVGLRARLGSREWATGLTGAADNQVRTVIPYTGSSETQTRLFVATSTGIWDVSGSGAVVGGAYATSTAYTAGTSVTLGGGTYVCSVAGTSDAAGAPPAWQANHTYSRWDMVTSNGNVYLQSQRLDTVTSGNSSMAPTGAADFLDTQTHFWWNYVGAAGAITNNKGLPPPWAPGTAYTQGRAVIFDGVVFYCYVAGTSGASAPLADGHNTVTDNSVTWDPVTLLTGSVYSTTLASAIPDNTATWAYLTSNTAPTQVFTFASPVGRAGFGVVHAQTTLAGNFLYYADEVNGLHLYTESTGLWTDATTLAATITGVDPADIVFVTVFKGFPMFCVRDSTDIFYLSAGAVTGAASRIGIGYKLQSGGSIVGLWSWTYDGGSGIDDSLVAISRGGDVVVFAGSNPADSSAFGISGVWSVGKMPAGRRVATASGGDLLLLTRSGVIPMSQLVTGRTLGAETYQTGKISPLFNTLMLTYGDTWGWSLNLHPEEAALLVTVPTGESQATTQMVMTLDRKAWSLLRDLPIFSCAPHEGKLFYGTVDGKVCINDGHVDGRPLYAPTSYTAIQYSGITAFQNLGSGTKKQVHLIRPHFVGQSSTTSFSVGARYDFNLTELDAVTFSAATGSVWDSGTWDSATWGSDYTPSNEVRGASGMGSNVAIAWRGASVDRTVLTGFELSLEEGGML